MTRAAPQKEVLRWTASFTLVLATHAGIALCFLQWQNMETSSAPPAAIMIDLAPLPMAPVTTPEEVPPAPKVSEKAPVPEPTKAPPKPEALPKPELPSPALPVPESAVTPQPQQPAAEAAAPQPALLEAAQTAAPQPGASTLPSSNALPNWQGLLLNHLERHKRYPRDAQWRHQEGVVYLHFTMDRSGKVLNYRVEKSSGFTVLDQETMALIERAQPLPPPPEDLSGATLDLVVPVQFFLRQR